MILIYLFFGIAICAFLAGAHMIAALFCLCACVIIAGHLANGTMG